MHLVIGLRSAGKKLAAVLLVILVLAGVHLVTDQAVHVVNSWIASRLVPIYKVDRPERWMAISFDAMWGTDYTDELLDILDRYQVKATFFLGGYWVEKYPEYVKKIHSRGHDVGNHSYSHPHMAGLSKAAIRQELERNHANIRQLIGEDPFLFRPPFGEYNNAVVEIASELGYYTVQWSIDSLDWKDVSADFIVNRVVSQAGPGEIVLLHNNGKNTAKAVARFIPILQQKGYRIVPISQLIYRDNYYIESHSGVQRPVQIPHRDKSAEPKGGTAR